MSFKENILKKIAVNRLADKVIVSLAPKGDVQKVDKESMRQLLDMAGYRRLEERDLELYVPPNGEDAKKVLVLDNGLAVYHTTVEDVAMRKSPTVKEMISIRNVVKILKDDDVVVSKKAETVAAVQKEGIDSLDLRFTKEDLDGIRLEGAASLEGGYPDGVVESLEIFAEVLGYRPPPKAFYLRHCTVTGALSQRTGGEFVYGPVAIFSKIHQTLKLIDTPMSSQDKEKMDNYRQVAEDGGKAPVEGIDVFKYLMEAAEKSRK